MRAKKPSEKWFEQSYDRELAGIRTSDIPKTRGSGGPKDHTIAALGTFQTVSWKPSEKSMRRDALGKLYESLSPEEHFRLDVEARARGDMEE